jgi:hypothetical protein
MKAVTREERRVAYPLVLIFALLAAGILTTGDLYYRHYERQFRADAERQLSAIAELKVNELVQYRKERLWDAATFFKNDALPDWYSAFSNTRKTPKRNRRFRIGRPNTWRPISMT